MEPSRDQRTAGREARLAADVDRRGRGGGYGRPGGALSAMDTVSLLIQECTDFGLIEQRPERVQYERCRSATGQERALAKGSSGSLCLLNGTAASETSGGLRCASQAAAPSLAFLTGHWCGRVHRVQGPESISGTRPARRRTRQLCRRLPSRPEAVHAAVNLEDLAVPCVIEGYVRDVATCDGPCQGKDVRLYQASLGSVPLKETVAALRDSL